MKVRIEINIECGENTCASEPGKFCEYAGSMKFGSIPVCMLFNGQDRSGGTSQTILEEKDGWVQRCPACKEHSTNENNRSN